MTAEIPPAAESTGRLATRTRRHPLVLVTAVTTPFFSLRYYEHDFHVHSCIACVREAAIG